jgi:hypothetical protein
MSFFFSSLFFTTTFFFTARLGLEEEELRDLLCVPRRPTVAEDRALIRQALLAGAAAAGAPAEEAAEEAEEAEVGREGGGIRQVDVAEVSLG